MRLTLGAIVSILAISAYGNVDQALIKESRKTHKLIQITSEDLTISEKEEVSDLLLEIREVILGNSGPSHDRQACTEHLYKLYYITQSSTNAMDNAAKACKNFVNLDFFKTLYEKAYISQSSANAVKTALLYSGKNSLGKGDLFNFIYKKYYLSLSSFNSLQKAGNAILILNKTSTPCIKAAYKNYYRSLSSTNAMDKSIIACK